MDIRFADHPSFQRAAAGMVGGALLFGTALHPVTALAPLAGGVLGIAAGAVIAHGKPWRLIGAGLALIPLAAPLAIWPAVSLAVSAALVALTLAIGGPRGLRGVASVAIGALAVLVALWCGLRIDYAQQTMQWSAIARTAVSAAAVGVVGALALLPRHLQLVSDPVRAALNKLPAILDAEVRGLCDRAAAIWATAEHRIADEPGRALVRDGVVKTLEVARTSAEVVVSGPSEAELARRVTDLDQRIVAATDGEVKAQYQAARAALADQQRYRDHIRQGRERLVARMHNHVAALEKFELAATGLGAARTHAAGSAMADGLGQLEALSHDVAASGDALAELELGDTAAA